jgi:hypothetical protein
MKLAQESNIFNLDFIEAASKRLPKEEQTAWILAKIMGKVRMWLAPQGSRLDQIGRTILRALHIDEIFTRLWKISSK